MRNETSYISNPGCVKSSETRNFSKYLDFFCNPVGQLKRSSLRDCRKKDTCFEEISVRDFHTSWVSIILFAASIFIPCFSVSEEPSLLYPFRDPPKEHFELQFPQLPPINLQTNAETKDTSINDVSFSQSFENLNESPPDISFFSKDFSVKSEKGHSFTEPSFFYSKENLFQDRNVRCIPGPLREVHLLNEKSVKVQDFQKVCEKYRDNFLTFNSLTPEKESEDRKPSKETDISTSFEIDNLPVSISPTCSSMRFNLSETHTFLQTLYGKTVKPCISIDTVYSDIEIDKHVKTKNILLNSKKVFQKKQKHVFNPKRENTSYYLEMSSMEYFPVAYFESTDKAASLLFDNENLHLSFPSYLSFNAKPLKGHFSSFILGKTHINTKAHYIPQQMDKTIYLKKEDLTSSGSSEWNRFTKFFLSQGTPEILQEKTTTFFSHEMDNDLLLSLFNSPSLIESPIPSFTCVMHLTPPKERMKIKQVELPSLSQVLTYRSRYEEPHALPSDFNEEFYFFPEIPQNDMYTALFAFAEEKLPTLDLIQSDYQLPGMYVFTPYIIKKFLTQKPAVFLDFLPPELFAYIFHPSKENFSFSSMDYEDKFAYSYSSKTELFFSLTKDYSIALASPQYEFSQNIILPEENSLIGTITTYAPPSLIRNDFLIKEDFQSVLKLTARKEGKPETFLFSLDRQFPLAASVDAISSESVLEEIVLPLQNPLGIPPALRDGLQHKSAEKINEEQRFTIANLSLLPTEYELEVNQLNHFFQVEVEVASRPDGPGFIFSIFFTPRKDIPLKSLKQNFYFLIDRSSSIQKHRFSSFKNSIVRALGQLKKNDAFNIIFFDKKIEKLGEKHLAYSPKNVQKAKHFLSTKGHQGLISHGNSLKLISSLKKEIKNSEELSTVILLSNGDSMSTLSRSKSRMHKLLKHYDSPPVSVYTAAASAGNNLGMLELVSRQIHGKLLYSPTNAAFPRKVAGLVRRLSSPIAYNVQVTPVNAKENLELDFCDEENPLYLHMDQPLKILGTIDRLESFEIMLQGKIAEGWLNVKKRISFENASKGGKALQKEYATIMAQKHYRNFIKEDNFKALKEADDYLTSFNLPSPN